MSCVRINCGFRGCSSEVCSSDDCFAFVAWVLMNDVDMMAPYVKCLIYSYTVVGLAVGSYRPHHESCFAGVREGIARYDVRAELWRYNCIS